MHNPFFSIIIPTYNRVDFLRKNIPELLLLNYNNYEIIVVDDGSTDNTSLLFNELKNNKLFYYSKQNEERAAARNFGVQKANGTYITFLDSDDILYPNALQMAEDALKQKEFPVFMHLAYEIGTLNKVNKLVQNIPDNNPLLFVKGNPLSCMGVFIKREAILQHPFNPDRNLAGSEDWELWVRLAAHYNLRTDNHIIGRLIEHDSRSVINYPEDKLKTRKELAMKYVFEDAAVQQLFGKHKNTMNAHWCTYIALHLAMSAKKKSALAYFKEAFKLNPFALLNKRALVIIKLLLLNK